MTSFQCAGMLISGRARPKGGGGGDADRGRREDRVSGFRVGSVLLGLLIVCAVGSTEAFGVSWPPESGRGACDVTKQANVPARMRDGTVLFADVYRPAATEPVPVILMRTQYGKEAAQMQPSRFQSPSWFASHCYIVVIQDIRGQYASEGTFYEYAHDRNDGYDSVEWAARLPGANGAVGMYGSSYNAATQWLAATATPPSLKAIVPSNTASDYYDGWTYENGAFRLGFIVPWMMSTIVLSAAEHRGDLALAKSLKENYKDVASWMKFRPYMEFPPFRPTDREVAPYFYDAIRHSHYDSYWEEFSIETRYAAVQVPVLAFEGWYDAFLAGGLKNFMGMVEHGGSEIARRNQRIVIGPWDHIGWGRPDSVVSPRLKAIGPVANSPVNELTLAWFDHFLKGKENGVNGGPRVDYFVMGENRWHAASGWPVPGTQYRSWYLGSGGHAASILGDGTLSDEIPGASSAMQDEFVYEPWNPVPSAGGHSCCAWNRAPQGQFDQLPIEQRSDVLVYSSPPLQEPVKITGPISVILYAASSAPDTDFTAKLIDVHPDGTAVNLNNGILSARFRNSLSQPSLINPGEIYKYTITVWPTSNLFKVGHRIRLEISSSDFPQFAQNPNTGDPLGTTKTWRAANQTIFHDQGHPSALILPIIPPEVAGGTGAESPPRL
jgi:putative CocE/NonD family hydrolase